MYEDLSKIKVGTKYNDYWSITVGISTYVYACYLVSIESSYLPRMLGIRTIQYLYLPRMLGIRYLYLPRMYGIQYLYLPRMSGIWYLYLECLVPLSLPT